ncbi:hypothetical protein IAQ61_009101 [Plenodomus lingam]|uniref:uncharacterized protein n=1 Tax=Leptosphaeria maculans TaxID=5022 RepID=UPI003329AEE5|nr:hypothetical protein IAQ61_009101 [Plenodomus lingam]
MPSFSSTSPREACLSKLTRGARPAAPFQGLRPVLLPTFGYVKSSSAALPPLVASTISSQTWKAHVEVALTSIDTCGTR